MQGKVCRVDKEKKPETEAEEDLYTTRSTLISKQSQALSGDGIGGDMIRSDRKNHHIWTVISYRSMTVTRYISCVLCDVSYAA